MTNYRCPNCNQVPLTVTNGNATINGNVTIVTDFPPPTWDMQFAKFSDCDQFLLAE